ncbi:MAG: DUF1971 domain-containing protein [Sphingobium sp.]|nr:DUF1971 domain-containing protein [Sphingobium sp.]
MQIAPYRSTPVFDQDSLPQALRSRHNTKAGVWGVLRVIEGELLYTCLDPAGETLLSPSVHMVIEPQQPHFVTSVGKMKIQVDFYDQKPVI